jgi:hypothetical protein
MANAKYKPPFGFQGPSGMQQDDEEDEEGNPYREGSLKYKKWESEHKVSIEPLNKNKTIKQVGGYGEQSSEEDDEEDEEQPEVAPKSFTRSFNKKQPAPEFIPVLPDDVQVTISMGDLKRLIQDASQV